MARDSKPPRDILYLRWINTRLGARLVAYRWKENQVEVESCPLPLRPYCFISNLRETDEFSDFPGVTLRRLDSSEARTLEPVENLYRIEAETPTQIRWIRDEYEKTHTVYEADVPYARRVFIDLDMKLQRVHRPLYVDIEVDPREKDSEPLKNLRQRILCYSVRTYDGDIIHRVGGDEASLIMSLDRLLNDHTMMISWSDFDYKYLRGRARKLGLSTAYLNHIPCLDLMALFARIILGSQVRLSETRYIALLEAAKRLGIEHTDFGVKEDYSIIWEWYERDQAKLKAYNNEDTRLLAAIDQRLHISKMLLDIAWELNIPVELFASFGLVNDFMLLRAAQKGRVRLILPCKPHIGREWKRSKEERLKGALVIAPTPGVHSYVGMLDFKSMYPSIITSLNISPDTIDLDGRLKTPVLSFTDKYDGLNRLVYRQVGDLLDKCGEELKATQPGSMEYAVAQHKRTFVKQIKNALYGTQAYRGYRIRSDQVLESVTAVGRALIEEARGWFERAGYPVLYGDTDSIFIKLPDGTVAPDKELEDRVNRYLKKRSYSLFGVEIDTELVFDTIFNPIAFDFRGKKKRYVARVVYDSKPCSYLKIAGYEIKRGDWVELAKEVQRKIIYAILEGKSIAEIRASMLPYLRELREKLFRAELDDKIVYKKGLRKELDEYLMATKPMHARAAVTLKELGLASQRSVRYVVLRERRERVVKDGKRSYRRVVDVYPAVDGRPSIEASGYEYVWKRQIIPILERFGIIEDKRDPLIARLDYGSLLTEAMTLCR